MTIRDFLDLFLKKISVIKILKNDLKWVYDKKVK